MPLPERVITPVNISRGTLQCSVPDELEGVTNGTLANIIRQLSSLSRHAEEMFGNLFVEAKSIADRSSSLQERIDRLAIRVTQLDSTVEEVSLQDIQLRKAYRSSNTFDQQVVSRESMPKAMLEVYLACDKPPPLDNLNPYRLDGKDGLKFYTDPNYFFELWRQEMVKDTERMMNDRGKKNHPGKVTLNGGPLVSNGGQKGDKHKKRLRQPSSTLERQRLKALGQGEYIMSPSANDTMSYFNQEDSFGESRVDSSPYAASDRPRPNSIEIQRSYSSSSSSTNIYNNRGEAPIYASRNEASPSYADGKYGLQKAEGGSPKYGSSYKRQDSGGLLVNQLQKQQAAAQYQTDPIYARGGEGSPCKKRPTMPPPAPPPGVSKDTNSGPAPPSGSGLPLPPPPMQQLIQEVSVVVQNGKDAPASPPGSDLPPPPPSSSTPSKSSLGPASVPAAHLPPSPPPPPPLPGSPLKEAASSSVPPPPPPPPPANGLSNGGADNRVSSGVLKSSSPAKAAGVLSPSGLKKPQPLNRPPQDDVRSDLLKAIRDGIALKKVEQRAAGEETSSDNEKGHIDVASILARRIAVEMSDSDEAQSDSECDSDDWGDESTA